MERPLRSGQVNNQPAMDEIVSLLLGYPAIEDTAMRARILDQVVRRAGEIDNAAPTARLPQSRSQRPRRLPSPRRRPRLRPSHHPIQLPLRDEGAKPEKPRERETLVPAPSKPFQTGQIDACPVTPAPAEVRPSIPVEARPSHEQEIAATDLPPAEHAPERMAQPPREASTFAHEVVASPPRPSTPSLGLDAPVTRLPAIGPSYAQKLAKLGVHTVRDLLYLLPHRYDDFSRAPAPLTV